MAEGDHVKVLFSLCDNYDHVINKSAKILDIKETSNVRLICKNAIVPKEAFRTLQQFISASFIKPDKLSFGLAKSTVDSGTQYLICLPTY